MTTEAIHYVGDNGWPTAACGLPFPCREGWTVLRENVTCPACLTAMGEPRVVSGAGDWNRCPRCRELVDLVDEVHDGSEARCYGCQLALVVVELTDGTFCLDAVVSGTDAVAAPLERTCSRCEWAESDCSCAPPPPAKPTCVVVGQRWRCTERDGTYAVVGKSGDGWDIQWKDGASWHATTSILADEYLGLAAPVETLAPAETVKPGPVPTVRCRCPSCVESGSVHYTTAAPTTPESASRRCHWMCDINGCLNPCALEAHRPYVMQGGVPCRCGSHSEQPAAPAPGAGEGAHELTFAEAMGLDPGDVEWTCDTLESRAWPPLALYQHLPLNYLRRCRFRLKPEPLPAPAPRPSRAAELAGTWTMSGKDPQACVLDAVTRAVEEALEAVRTAIASGVVLAAVPAAARAAMLEARK